MPDSVRPKIAVIDLGMGNLFSIRQACAYAGLEAFDASDGRCLAGSDGLILPGIGAFGDAMDMIKKLDLAGAVSDFINSGKPVMAICLGMQILFTESEEFGRHKGLNIVRGFVRRLPSAEEKVPQVGWNRIGRSLSGWEETPLSGTKPGEFMYFVHSYYCEPEEKSLVLALTEYAGIRYCSGMSSGNIFATQFHPEKSGPRGLNIYKNWASLIRGVHGA